MSASPLILFAEFLDKEKKLATTHVPEAACLSTIGLDGFPNARFVAIKEITDSGLVVTGPIQSLKAREILSNPKIALTAWFPNVAVQIRVQGIAKPLDRQKAEALFSDRNRESQIVSTVSRQGRKLDDPNALEAEFAAAMERSADRVIPCPSDWGGYEITPKRIEILEFSAQRFHKRSAWTYENGGWSKQLLQP